jgi:hypothetical protein
MQKINEQQKKNIYGGIGPMMLWVGIMGGVMIAQTIISTITSVCDNFQSHDANNKSNASTSKRNSMYMRVSPFPARSAVSMWM